MKTKKENFNKFQDFKALVKKKTGKSIRILRTNNGGEFESCHFEYFFKEEGIKRQLIVPYNPQQNGVVERKNMTICEESKPIMYDVDLPISLWDEATRTIVYV